MRSSCEDSGISIQTAPGHGRDGAGARLVCTVMATNYGGSVSSPNSLWFGDSGSRFIITRPIDTTAGGMITFNLRMADGSGSLWERADLPGQGIVLESWINGGTTWLELARYTNAAYSRWTRVSQGIPQFAQGSSVVFRWRQLSHGSANTLDHWALDDVLIGSAPRPPIILAQPTNRLVSAEGTTEIAVQAVGIPLPSYQWRFNGVNLPGETNRILLLTGVNINQAGTYTVVVGNGYGELTSTEALLTVIPLDSGLFDGFDPDIDRTEWSAFGGFVGLTVRAANYGGRVSPPNALWFGDSGNRFATTRSLNTSRGGAISFDLRMGYGSASTWLDGCKRIVGSAGAVSIKTLSNAQWSLVAVCV